ncbi:MAG: NAD(P)-dependent oxidoreductase [Treponema sp.]|nr:NAD(P)-dependent oxidoreductase [Treponema sp.]
MEEEIPSYTLAEAISEAKRCLKCKVPQCRTGCPIENDIPAFNNALSQGNIGEAYSIISLRSNLPAVCGRVCPHENQCEGHCVMNRMKKPIQIGRIERFVADFEADFQLTKIKKVLKTQGKVAVIGSGPAGIACAGDLVKKGYEVVVFERDSDLGGVLLYGIPEFRLPKVIVRRELARLQTLGVTFKTDVTFGKDITLESLKSEGFDAVFMGIGAGVPKKIGVPGEGASGSVDALDFLHKVREYEEGKLERRAVPIAEGDTVVVIGAGNVAMDACRSAVRMGAKHVMVCYRRTIEFMKASRAEYDGAVSDGVEFKWEHVPVAYELRGDTVCGFRSKTPDGEYVIPVTKIIAAIGSGPAEELSGIAGLSFDDGGYIQTQTEPYYGATGVEGLFAAGDVVHHPKTVVMAMREGKKAAGGIDAYYQATHNSVTE